MGYWRMTIINLPEINGRHPVSTIQVDDSIGGFGMKRKYLGR
jgi:hypothetical protein